MTAQAAKLTFSVSDIADGTNRPKISRLEFLFAIFTVLLYQYAFFPLAAGPQVGTGVVLVGGETESNWPSKIAQVIVLVVLSYLTYKRREMLKPIVKFGRPYILVIGLCFLSTVWSLYPLVTARRSLLLVGCFLFGYYGYIVYGPRNFIRLLAISGIVAAFFSIVVSVVLPSYGMDRGVENAGAYKGVYSQKNQLSIYVLLSMCNAVYLGFLAKNRSVLDKRIGYCIIILVLALILSKGVTSMLAAIFVFGLGLILYLGKSSKTLTIGYYALGLIGVTAVFVYAMDPGILFRLTGKDTTLTGRLPIWLMSIDFIKKRPLFGYGYTAFWDPDSPITQYIWVLLNWRVPGSHNGFIELTLYLGVVGLSLYLFLIGRLTQLTIRALRYGTLDEARWLALFLVAMLIENLDEGTLAEPDLLASQVAFGTAITGVWWYQTRMKILATTRRPAFPALNDLKVLDLKGLPAVPART